MSLFEAQYAYLLHPPVSIDGEGRLNDAGARHLSLEPGHAFAENRRVLGSFVSPNPTQQWERVKFQLVYGNKLRMLWNLDLPSSNTSVLSGHDVGGGAPAAAETGALATPDVPVTGEILLATT
jgi:hypothetical protein